VEGAAHAVNGTRGVASGRVCELVMVLSGFLRYAVGDACPFTPGARQP